MQNVMTLRWSVLNEEFEVLLDGRWVGRVWADARGWWTGQDFDGDCEGGFNTFLGAAFFVKSMSGGMVW